jgi:hypothetical protein
MAHPVVLALFMNRDAASAAGPALHALGIPSTAISVVARTHKEEAVLAHALSATPGAEIEDSPTASRLGEIAGRAIALVAVILPGIGPIVAGGPLGAEFAEISGEISAHLPGGLVTVLERTGVEPSKARQWQTAIERGALLLGVHVVTDAVDRVSETLQLAGADDLEVARWAGELPV